MSFPKIFLVRRNVVEDNVCFDEVGFAYCGESYFFRAGYVGIPKDVVSCRNLFFVFNRGVEEDDFCYYVPFLQLLRLCAISEPVVKYYDQGEVFRVLFARFLSFYPDFDVVCKEVSYFYV